MFTICYMAATFLQSWKIKSVSSKIAEKLAVKSSIVFFIVPSEEGYDPRLATSELCTNRSQSKVSEILWLNSHQRGCCLEPLQTIYISPWVSFPASPNLVPFEYNTQATENQLDKSQLVYLLLEAESYPIRKKYLPMDIVKIEEYGKPLAWKLDSHFAVLVESDLYNFTKLIIATFLQNNLLINDQLPLIRIESIQYEGIPQSYELVTRHLQKLLTSRSERYLEDEDWKKHLDGLRSLSVLANQAIEFEYNKNRTEGKTGVIKPDLIPQEKKSFNESILVDKNEKTSIPLPIERLTVEDSSTSLPFKKAETAVPIRLTPTEVVVAENLEPLLETKSTEFNSAKIPPNTHETISGIYILKGPLEVSKEVILLEEEPIESKSQSPQKELVVNKVKVEQELVLSEGKEEKKSSINENLDIISSANFPKSGSKQSKTLNILVYSDSISSKDSAIATLKECVENDMYTIYPLTPKQAEDKYWFDSTALLVVCGSVEKNIGSILVDYFLCGGKILSLCSDILHIVLNTYHTAEIREHKLVQFSYDRWHKVKMMHHIFCYQPSPVKKNFSTDSDDLSTSLPKRPALVCPRSVEIKDLGGKSHNLDVQILGAEETWNTPSLLIATDTNSHGKAVFSQVHLEVNPSQFEYDEKKYFILKESNKVRLEIFEDLLSKRLNISVKTGQEKVKYNYKEAYFLGHHENKFQLIEKLKETTGPDGIIKTPNLLMKFCDKDEKNIKKNVLPILIHSCPDNFSTVEYFDNLKTRSIGRLVIYIPIVNSSMNVICDLELTDGITVLPRQQTEGTGRKCNQWISPLGCAMFSIQMHIPLNSLLGSRIPLIQHIIATSIIYSIKKNDTYKDIDIGVKWPNDIYANGATKIGGVTVKTNLQDSIIITNIGAAINLDNSKPTICLNDLITNINKLHNRQMPLLKYEKLIAEIFNEIEFTVSRIQTGDIDYFYKLYYKLWLHTEQNICVVDKDGKKKEAKITGIDDYGYLKVQLANGSLEIVQPDGNSFDMLKGLIIPKFS